MELDELKEKMADEGDASLELKGRWEAIEKDPETGEVLNRSVDENVITEDGAVALADMLAGNSVTDFTYLAIGDGPAEGESEDVTQSSLQNEVARNEDSDPTTSDDESGHKVTWTATFGPGDCVATEFGLLNDSTDGTLLSYNITEIAKDADNAELTLNYELIVNEG